MRNERLLVAMAGAWLSLSCLSERPPDPEDSAEESLEVFSWWTNAGESEALSALFDRFHGAYPKVVITNVASVDPTRARDRLRVRMDNGEPPDSFQAIAGLDLLSWVERGDMRSLNELAEQNDWEAVFPEEVLDIMRRDGQLYGVPVNIERDNNLYFNVALFEQQGLTAPKTLPDFYATCATLKQDEIVPLALPAAGWVLALVAFENLMPSVMGGAYYHEFFAGKADPTASQLRHFFFELKKVLECSNVATASPSWTENADLMFEGKAASYVMGDWLKGYYEEGRDAAGKERRAWIPRVDFDVVPGLGSAGMFVFNSAAFGLPERALHPRAARAFLTLAGSHAGQQAFNPIKGSVPARTDADLSAFDDMVKDAVADFKMAAKGENRLLAGYAALTTFDYQKEVNPSLLVFAVGGFRARQLDPKNVPESEAEVPALDLDYIMGKIEASYSLLGE